MDLLRKKAICNDVLDEHHLLRCLSAVDLTLLGVGAIIGAGIFVLTGIVAATLTGPAIVLSYVLAGLACAFSALAYAELAASIGGCGSAYGYAYAGLGELLAWIVGWDLLLEYAVAVSAVSVGWSGYFNDFLLSLNLHLPKALLHSPLDGGEFNLLALGIIFFLTGLLIAGVKSSARLNNIMVLTKLAIIFLFIYVALGQVNVQNWVNFAPFGWEGIVNGASIIFFAYVGFDAVSTAGEEALNPQRDLPIGIIGSLVICTLIYIIVSGLLTGIADYKTLNVTSPISHTLLNLGFHFTAGLIGIGAIAGLTTVMLVMFYGFSRVFFSMSRDGLLPFYFSKLHPKTKTPIRIILPSGLFIAATSALIPMSDLAELVNIGTLFAFIIVCTGVIVLRKTHPELPRPFKTPFFPMVPILGILASFYLIMHLPWVTIVRFIVWMLIGLGIYFKFSRNNSLLNPTST